jgi:hypothetical protein
MTLRRRLGRIVSGPAETPAAAAPASHRRKGATKGKMLRAKPPNVRGRGPLLAGAGFGVVLVCIVKDEADYLEEWLGYHIALGVDHFVVYDNGSTDGSAELLRRYINHGLVTRLDWPLGGGQLAAYNHALRMFGTTARWLAYYDVDEFLVPLADDDIPSFLARFEDAAVVRVPRLEFGYDGHRTPPAGLAIDEYTQVANVLDLDPALPPRVKSIVQPGAVSAVDIHLAFPADEPTPGQPTETAEGSVRGLAQLNHYYTRSFEEFEAKRDRGSATGRIARRAVPFDLPTIETNTSARRFSERTSTTMARLARLDPRPYSYGSELALAYFPRPNDLFRFAEFAIANTAAGWTEPGRVAATRLKNLHDGIGLVADLAGTDWQPTTGGLRTSVHTEALVAHMRGAVTAATPPAEGAPAVLDVVDGAVSVTLDLVPTDELRCVYLGFVLSVDAEARLACSVALDDGGSSPAATCALPASRLLAGVIEVQPTPVDAVRLDVRLETAAETVSVVDLFVIQTG